MLTLGASILVVRLNVFISIKTGLLYRNHALVTQYLRDEF
jgi:hypothetical protein